MTGYTAETKH